MTCPWCHAENRADMRFCGSCAAPLVLSCQVCKADNPVANRFCGQCGAPLDHYNGGEQNIPGPASVGELKRVSVLFCDLVDSTGLAERLGPEVMHELIRGFMDAALAEVRRYGGTAPQFTGDGFMALFGAPAAHEDHVRRALLAALAIRDRVSSRDEHSGDCRLPQLQMHIGIHTGLVVFGPVGGNLRMDPTAIGDAANIAARLQGAASPGSILISEETYRIAHGYAEVEEVGPLLLKGKEQPISTYRLVGVSHQHSALEDASLRRPFVNRKRELSLLLDLVAPVEEGRGQALGIVGEAGIGKSRLVAEFHRRIGDRMSWVEGRCLSYGTSTPYLLVLDLLRSICGIVETDPPEAISSALRAKLHEHGVDSEQNALLLMHLLGIAELDNASLPSSPEAVKAKAFDILRQLCIGISLRRPLVLALEDLHWIDTISEEFIAFLADAVSGSRILLLAAYRPGYRLPWIDKSYAGQMTVQALARADSLAVVRSIGERLDAPVTEAILAKADGNPLFLEQLALHAGEARHGQSAGMVPDTVHDVVAARIDRLPEETKRLLQTASVAGREFSRGLLEAVWQPAGPIDSHLQELTRLEFIDEEPEREGPTYVFRHALTQEMAYASLLERYRRGLHTVVGNAIEKLYAGRTEEIVEQLAFHFAHSDKADKAVRYAISAAEKAQRRWANTEALAYFSDALRRLDTMPDNKENRLYRIDAVLKQGDVRYGLAQYTEYLNVLTGIRKLIAGVEDPRRQAVWHYWTGLLHSVTGGRPSLAIEHCREAAKIAMANGLEEIEAFAEACLAQAYVGAGQPGNAVTVGERALASFEGHDNPWWAARTLWFLSIAANCLGKWRASLAYCRRGLDQGAAINDPRFKSVQPVGWWRMGSTYIQQGDLGRGLECCEKALADDAILQRDVAMARAVHGYGQIKAGRFDAGIAELTEALGWLQSSGLRYAYLTDALLLAEGYLRCGDTENAHTLAQDTLEGTKASGYLHLEGRSCWLMGDCLAAEGSPAAEGYVKTAIEIFERVGAQNDLARALVTRAALRQRADDCRTARELLEHADILFEELETQDEPLRVAAALAALDRGEAVPVLASGAG